VPCGGCCIPASAAESARRTARTGVVAEISVLSSEMQTSPTPAVGEANAPTWYERRRVGPREQQRRCSPGQSRWGSSSARKTHGPSRECRTSSLLRSAPLIVAMLKVREIKLESLPYWEAVVGAVIQHRRNCGRRPRRAQ